MGLFGSTRGGYQIRSDRLYFLTLTIVQWIRLFDKEGFKDIFLESLGFAQKEGEFWMSPYWSSGLI